MKKYIAIVINSLFFYACCSSDLSQGFSLYNHSDDPISFYMPWQNGIYYPDTILPEKNPNPYAFKKEFHFSFGEGKINENALFALLPTDTISIFFFCPDTLANYDWTEIRKEYKILARYDLSHTDLKILNWSIHYPPTAVMKNMKTYTPCNGGQTVSITTYTH
jgi:hypothetical protein